MKGVCKNVADDVDEAEGETVFMQCPIIFTNVLSRFSGSMVR